jgi:hypothetical protein
MSVEPCGHLFQGGDQGTSRSITCALGGNFKVPTEDVVGSSWRMSALLALFSIAMIGYLYGCKTDDR